MAQLVVRNLEDDVRDKLRDRALTHGHSMEEEVRDILRAAVMQQESTPKKLGSILAERFAGQGLSQDIPELRGGKIEPPRFEP